jgi:hypothetical protein
MATKVVDIELLEQLKQALETSTTVERAQLANKLEHILGGWKSFSELLPADVHTLIEIKSGSSTLLATQIRIPGEVTKLAYVSMDESGIDWVNAEDVDGWRPYEYSKES